MARDELTQKLNKLKHIQVYNRIYQMIQEGIYPPGMQLPSEPELADKLNVSRSTLRKSLALLQEDHLVKNVRGKGNFIRELPETPYERRYEKKKHPIQSCLDTTITEVELEFRLEVPSDAITTSIQQETPVVIIADRWYHTAEGTLAYSLSFIPIEVLSEANISLQDTQPLLQFLEHQVYQDSISSHSQSHFGYTTSGNFSSTKYTLSNNGQFILIQENIFSHERLLASNKHYLPIEHFNLFITSQ